MERFFSNRNSNRRDDRERPTMHKAKCDKCGKDCEVPFKPSGSKPIFCSRCFEKEPGGNSNRGERRDRDDREGRRDYRDSGSKSMFSAVCDECGRNCEVPFKPSSNKPIYCSKCFENVDSKRSDTGRREPAKTTSCDISPLKEELSSIGCKLDKLIELLTPVKEEKKIKVKPKAKPKKVKKEKK